MRVLVIEDDPAMVAVLRDGFRAVASSVDVAFDGENGLALAMRGEHDVVVLDLMLPRRDGFDVLRELRASRVDTPVICLTARDAVEDRVAGLNLGADDYLTKPFSFMELLARVRAVLRRGTSVDRSLVIDDLEIDLPQRIVYRGGRRLSLSPTEYILLERLARHHGEVLSRSTLLREVWGIEFDPGTNVVDVHINRLRRKVDRGCARRLIQTVRGVGYALAQTPS